MRSMRTPNRQSSARRLTQAPDAPLRSAGMTSCTALRPSARRDAADRRGARRAEPRHLQPAACMQPADRRRAGSLTERSDPPSPGPSRAHVPSSSAIREEREERRGTARRPRTHSAPQPGVAEAAPRRRERRTRRAVRPAAIAARALRRPVRLHASRVGGAWRVPLQRAAPPRDAGFRRSAPPPGASSPGMRAGASADRRRVEARRVDPGRPPPTSTHRYPRTQPWATRTPQRSACRSAVQNLHKTQSQSPGAESLVARFEPPPPAPCPLRLVALERARIDALVSRSLSLSPCALTVRVRTHTLAPGSGVLECRSNRRYRPTDRRPARAERVGT